MSRRAIGCVVSVGLCVLIWATVITRTGSDTHLEMRSAAIAPWMLAQSPVLVSPDGRELLQKRDYGLQSEMVVSDLVSGRVIGTHRGSFQLLIAWRPPGREISFLEDRYGDARFKLKLWTPLTGEFRSPPIPGEWLAADRLMKWSPDGMALAFRAITKTGERLALFEPALGAVRFLAQVPELLKIAWSPDGKLIAVTWRGSAGVFAIVDVRSGGKREIVAQDGAELNDIAWSADGEQVLVSGRAPGGGGYRLIAVGANGGLPKIVSGAGQSVASPLLVAGNDLLYHSQFDGNVHLVRGQLGQPFELFGPTDGIVAAFGVNRTMNAVIASYTSPLVPRCIVAIDLDTAAVTSLRHFQQQRIALAPEALRVMCRDGGEIVGYIWRAAQQPSRGAVIKFPTLHGSHPPSAFDGGCQYLINRGYDYVTFDFLARDAPPKDVYDISERDIDAALGLVEHVQQVTGLAQDRIVLMGESNGTRYVARTAARLKPMRGGLVLRGIPGDVDYGNLFDGHEFVIGALQGENDPLCSPKDSFASVRRAFGRGSLSGAMGFSVVLKMEGHTPRRLGSKAIVISAIEEVLERLRGNVPAQ